MTIAKKKTKTTKKAVKRAPKPTAPAPAPQSAMISNIDQLKNLIMWCKDQKVKKLDLGDVKFEISEIDFIPEEAQVPLTSTTGPYNTETLVDTLEEEGDWHDDPDLYHST